MIFSRLSIFLFVLLLAGCATSISVPPAELARINKNGVITAHTSQVTVQQADKLHSIAHLYGVDELELARINHLSPPYQLTSGQVLRLPEPLNLGHTFDKTLAAPPLAAVPNDAVVATDLAPVGGPMATTENQGVKTHANASGVITETELAPPPTPAAKTVAAPMAPSSPKPSLGTGVPRFSWPVNGSTLSEYGAKAGGRHNDGINIGAPLGTTVRAAAAGDVVYAGDKIAGFGNLLLIKHNGGFATAYAHLQNPIVKTGDHVTAGQSIAQIGKTGNVSTPQLHFEIRKGTSAINPAGYLP